MKGYTVEVFDKSGNQLICISCSKDNAASMFRATLAYQKLHEDGRVIQLKHDMIPIITSFAPETTQV